MAKENLFVRHSFLTAIKELSMAERGRLFTAMLEYSIEGNTPVLGGAERIIWPIAQDMIDTDNERYEEVSAKRSAAGQASVNKRQQVLTNAGKCQPTPTPTSTPVIKEKISTSVDIQKKSAASGRFSPPTLEEVTAYCLERGSSVDPKTFYDYFTAGNWTDSKGQKVKSWKQKLITWENHQQRKREGTGNPFLDIAMEGEL